MQLSVRKLFSLSLQAEQCFNCLQHCLKALTHQCLSHLGFHYLQQEAENWRDNRITLLCSSNWQKQQQTKKKKQDCHLYLSTRKSREKDIGVMTWGTKSSTTASQPKCDSIPSPNTKIMKFNPLFFCFPSFTPVPQPSSPLPPPLGGLLLPDRG